MRSSSSPSPQRLSRLRGLFRLDNGPSDRDEQLRLHGIMHEDTELQRALSNHGRFLRHMSNSRSRQSVDDATQSAHLNHSSPSSLPAFRNLDARDAEPGGPIIGGVHLCELLIARVCKGIPRNMYQLFMIQPERTYRSRHAMSHAYCLCLSAIFGDPVKFHIHNAAHPNAIPNQCPIARSL